MSKWHTLTAYLLKWSWAVEKYQAPLAQRIRAPGFGPGGRGFESLTEYHASANYGQTGKIFLNVFKDTGFASKLCRSYVLAFIILTH